MFDKVKGQKKAMEQLEADLASGRLAESYLFAGPEGSRMREAAMEFAKAVNCLNVRRQSLIPDNEIAKLPCGEH